MLYDLHKVEIVSMKFKALKKFENDFYHYFVAALLIIIKMIKTTAINDFHMSASYLTINAIILNSDKHTRQTKLLKSNSFLFAFLTFWQTIKATFTNLILLECKLPEFKNSKKIVYNIISIELHPNIKKHQGRHYEQ